jgi:hypothetical protein
MKNSSDCTGNRTHDITAFSAVPQPTAPPHTLLSRLILQESLYFIGKQAIM